ncbi:class I SAM-dependent methyltransferase [Solirubrobacter phytolaccae]|uniref:Class I SAM-dependent methyltransferase n=1 Tax=Solirubrobacter phytolaccae TaxID=1404360 RepID=A0A9X3S8H4_9ACTN|nr:class I SAM-dependent methyltransferase [Solirubrobacter phytolaccae]MDA0180306.1 class I SAM-dependent methyltransferase [Solirubrobacter phytolaccae]
MLMSPTNRLQRLADDSSANSLSHRLRARRFQLFEQLIGGLDRPLSIIDVGGTNRYWEQRGWAGRDDISITLVNLEAEPQVHANIQPTAGDATDLSEHADDSFDIAFSNSVIEHLFTVDNQAKMAREIQRVGRAYWVQTPNFWFPIEPHFLVPVWHWLPESTRVAILRRRGVGWAGRTPDADKALRVIQEHRLMRRSELAHLFPDAKIVGEKFGGLTKSWTALGGFPALDRVTA